MINPNSLNNIFKSGPLPTLLVLPDAPQFTITDVNSAYLLATATKETDLLGKGLFEAFPENPADVVSQGVSNLRTSLLTVLASGKPHKMPTQKYDILIVGTDEFTVKYWEPENIPILDEAGNITLLMHTVVDVTERILLGFRQDEIEKQALLLQHTLENKNTLKDLIRRLETAHQIAQLGYWKQDLDLRNLYWSKEVYSIWGVTPETFKTSFSNFYETIYPEDRPLFDKVQKIARENQDDLDVELRILLPDNSLKFVHIKGAFMRDETGFPLGIEGTVQDITSRKKAEEQVREINQRFQYVTQATSDAIWDWDLQTDMIYSGIGFQTLFGFHPEKMEKNISFWKEHLHPEDRERVITGIYKLIEGTQTNWQDEYRFLKSNGNYAYVIDKGFVIRNDQGKGTRMVGAMQDISQQKEEELRLKLLESVITNTKDSILITEAEPFDEPGPRIIYVNEAFTEMTGYTAEEVIGKTPRILQGPETDQEEINRLSTALRKWEPCEITVINYKKNGEKYWIHMSISPVADQNGWFTHWISIERDVTEQKNKEQQKALLVTISALFNKQYSLKQTLTATLELLSASMHLGIAEAWLVNRDKKHIELQASFQKAYLQSASSHPNSHEPRSLEKGDGLPGLVWETGCILSAADSRIKDNYLQKLPAGLNNQQTFGIPLLSNNEVRGVLIIHLPGSQKTIPEICALFSETCVHISAEIIRKQLELELNQVFNSVPDIISIAGLDGYFKKINPAATKLLEFTEEEFLSIPFTEFMHPEDKELMLKGMMAFDNTKHSLYFENRSYTKSGKLKWLAWNTEYIAEEGVFYGVAKDITERKELENLLKKTYTLATIGSWEVDHITGKHFWSDIMKEIYEVDPDFEPSFDKVSAFYTDGPDREQFMERMSNRVENGIPWDEEMQITTIKGERKWVRSIGQSEFEKGKCTRSYGTLQDIDLRKKAELSLLKTLDEKNTILESIGDGFFAVNKQWMVTYWNVQAETMLGLPKQTMLGSYLWDTFSTQTEAYTRYHLSMDTSTTVHFEIFYPRLEKWYEVSSFPSETGLSVYFKDISTRKEAEIIQKKAAEQQSLFVSIINSSDDAIISKRMDGIITSWNKGAENIFGYTAQEIIGNSIYWLIPPNLYDEEIFIMDKIKKGIHVSHYETTRIRKDGSTIIVSLTISPVCDIDGRIIGASKIAREITEQKKTQEAIRISNERYNLVAKATNDSIWDWDIRTGKVTRTGDGFTALFGYKIEQANDDNLFWTKLVHPDDLDRILDSHQRLFNNTNEFYWEDEYRFLKADGQYGWVYDKGYMIRDENGKPLRMIGATQDITQKKEQVNEITRIKQNLDSLVNTTNELIWSLDNNFKIITANKTYTRWMEQYTGSPIVEGDDVLSPALPADTIALWKGYYTRALAGETFSVERRFTQSDSSEPWYNIVSFSPIKDKDGVITGVACFAKDITELKQSASRLEKLNTELENKAKELSISNTELEQFAYVASHDLQEPLRMVTSFLTQLEKKYSDIIDEKGKKYIYFAVDGAKRMRQIILDLLEFSRVGRTEDRKEEIDINELIEDIKALFRKQIEERNALIEYSTLPRLHSFKTPLRQVFQNLVGNALKYSRKDIPAHISIGATELTEYWQFVVTDNGIGIDEQYFDKIFIIFQRLHNKDEYSGTGMGLAVTKKIIENLGGTIWVKSAEGRGSSFYFTIKKEHL